ncbi:MAG: hypothetical protein F6K50_06430 [Moorea sp. SIO3I7]|nr:hypothetical protein [Moorena sp. SIO3I7]
MSYYQTALSTLQNLYIQNLQIIFIRYSNSFIICQIRKIWNRCWARVIAFALANIFHEIPTKLKNSIHPKSPVVFLSFHPFPNPLDKFPER